MPDPSPPSILVADTPAVAVRALIARLRESATPVETWVLAPTADLASLIVREAAQGGRAVLDVRPLALAEAAREMHDARACPERVREGVPQGGPISPLLSNLYLNEVDKMLERAKDVTRNGRYTVVEYARYADDLVILIDGHPRNAWAADAVVKRLREEFDKLGVSINEDKSGVIDLRNPKAGFDFLGFRIKRVLSRRGRWRPLLIPQMKARKALLQKLKVIFRRFESQPVYPVIERVNPIVRGWVEYFRYGNSSQCFGYVRDWLERKNRRHLMRARGRRGFGWKRWSRDWIYDALDSTRIGPYGVSASPKAAHLDRSLSPVAKPSGKRSEGDPHAAFDVAGPGNVVTDSNEGRWRKPRMEDRNPTANAPGPDESVASRPEHLFPAACLKSGLAVPQWQIC